MNALVGEPDAWSVELLRGIAAMLVVTAHYVGLTGWQPGLASFAFTGVDLFFVLSGFVFAPQLFGKKVSMAGHFVRRFFRLYPLYVVALIAYAFGRYLQDQSTDHLVKHLLFAHTWQTREVAFHYNPAFWSLPPEVEYYLALPLLALLCSGIASVLALAAVALGLHVALAWLSPMDPAATGLIWVLLFHLPALLIEFMLGSLAWWAVRRGPGPAWRVAWLVAGLIGWFCLANLFMSLSAAGGEAAVLSRDILRGNVGLLAALAFALLVAAWVGWVRQPPAWLHATALAMGNLSYGVYLFHNALPAWLAPWRAGLPGWAFAALCLGATVLLSQVLHMVWEKPWRAFGRRWAARVEAGRAERSATG